MNSLIIKAKKIFTDSIKIKVQGGKGGHGFPQYGGIGGKGGDVYLKGSSMMTLNGLIKSSSGRFFKASDGQPAKRTRLLGEEGGDLIIKVPLGVTVQDLNNQFLGEINTPKDKIIVAMGGRGGDKFNDNQGFVGQGKYIKLDLKMISDAALVGFPNAGKSSLISVLSNAKPKVAAYPFTTLKPNLGVIEFSDYRQIKIADLPGLVEGAHKNLGLGHEFLKHMERTKLLVFMVDINNADLGPAYARRSPLETLCILNKEIELYDDTILNKPAILVVSKMDTLQDSKERFKKLNDDLDKIYSKEATIDSIVDTSISPSKLVQFYEIVPISSTKHKNINELKNIIRDVIDRYAEVEKLEKDKFSSYGELQSIENNRIV